jgi:hypothetical protein
MIHCAVKTDCSHPPDFAPDQYMKPNMQIRAYGVENVFHLLSSNDQDLTPDKLVKILNYRDLDEADQLGPEPK